MAIALFFLIIKIMLIWQNNCLKFRQNSKSLNDNITNFFPKLVKQGEISKTEFDQIRPKNAKPATAHILLKMRKTFNKVPKF